MKNIISLLVIFIASCSAKERVQHTSDEFLPGEKLAELQGKNLREISGMVSSINNPKHFWVHNDAGNKAEVYLLDENLNVKLMCELEGIENRDWEDIAIGPGPDSNKNYLYIGEIGDNDDAHRYKYVYRFEEPVWNKSDDKLTLSAFDKITFQLADGPKDTETLLLDPTTKNLYVVSKREEPVYLYELKYPYKTEEPNIAVKLTTLPITKISGGDLSPDGQEIVLKNYDQIFYWTVASQQPIAEALKAPAKVVPYEKEPQGEAITWSRDGTGFYTLSEVTKGKKVFLYFYKRNDVR